MQNEKLKITIKNSKFWTLNFNFAFLIFIFKFLIVISTAFAAETDWTVHIKVSVPYPEAVDGTAWNHLIAGVREGATDRYDSTLDTLSMVEVDDPVQAMFNHGVLPEDKDNDGMIDRWACNSPEDGYNEQQCSLWRDNRAFDGNKVWSFLVLSILNGGTAKLQWAFEGRHENIKVFLVDLSNPSSSMDMKNASFYSYTNNFEQGKKYGIRYFEIRMEARGLFVSPPVLPDGTVNTLYNTRLSAVGGIPVWSIEDGDLPPGMFIDTYTGEVSGTPTVTGVYTFTIRVDDPQNGMSSLKEYTININSIPEIDTLSLPDGIAGGDYSGRISATGGSEPLKWSIKGNLPEGVILDSKTGVISGTLVVPGIYDFTAMVKDVNGATDSKDFRITVIEPEDTEPPGAIDNLRGIYMTDTSVLLIWTAPSDDSMTGTAAIYDLRYMKDCSGALGLDWDKAIEAIGEPRPQTGAIQTYTLTGIKAGELYCVAIRSMDAKGHVSEISNIVMLPLSENWGDILNLSPIYTSITLRKGYNLISTPLIPVPNGRDSLFGPVVGDPVAFYRWYSAYPGITPPQYYLEDIVMPGLGYFLYSPADNIMLGIGGLEIKETAYRVALQKGWNMIGNPYNKTILLRDISVKDNVTGEMRSFVDAVKGGWIGNTVYYLKGGSYDFASFSDTPPASLEPWIGYWIYVGAENGVEIIFRRP